MKGEILSAPAVAENEVIVRTVDGKLRALALADGKEIWSAEQQIPRLTLRGAAAPVVARDVAISGFDNGRVLAVSLADGATVWDSPVSPPHGRTELERLNDIDAAVKVVGDEVFVAGFQGRAAMLALDSGQIWWTRDVSSYRGVDVDDEQMYVSTSQGELVAIKRRTGVEVWRNDVAEAAQPVGAGGGGRIRRGRRSRGLRALVRPRHRRARRAHQAGGDRVTNAPLAVEGMRLRDHGQGRHRRAAWNAGGEPGARRRQRRPRPNLRLPAPAPAPGG